MKKIRRLLSKLKDKNHLKMVQSSAYRYYPPKVVNLINRLLDEECLAKIFQWLPAFEILQLELVCKKWNRASKLAWSYVTTIERCSSKTDLSSLTQYKFIKMLSYCNLSQLKKLVIPDFEYDSDLIKFINDNCRDLIEIDIDFGSVVIDENYLATALSKMKKLKIFKMNFAPDSEEDEAYQSDLENDNYTTDINDGPLLNKLLAQLPAGLEKITFISLPLRPINSHLSEGFSQLLQRFKSLTHLTLRSYKLDITTVNSISKINKLIHLDIGMTEIINDIPITNNENLKYLDISGCTYDRDTPGKRLPCERSKKTLNEISKLKNLTHLNISYVKNLDDETIVSISNNCRYLEYLDLSNCLSEIISMESFGELSKLSNLKYLNFSDVIVMNGNLVTDIDWKKIDKLIYLDISGCNIFSRKSFNKIGTLKNLKYLMMRNVFNTDYSIFNKLRNLKILDCWNCRYLNDTAIQIVIKNCHFLEYFDTRFTKITIDSLIFAVNIVKKRKNNIVLNISVTCDVEREFIKTNCYTENYLGSRDWIIISKNDIKKVKVWSID